MRTIEIIYSIITILSLIGGILAWIAKLKWSKEYKEAKEAQIEALKQQVQTFKDFTSDKVKEIFLATKEILEIRIKELEAELIKIETEKNNEKLERERIVRNLEEKLAKNSIELNYKLEQELSKIIKYFKDEDENIDGPKGIEPSGKL